MSLTIHGQQTIEAEKAVLGSVFLDNQVMDDIAESLEPRDFSQYAHQIIWKALLYMHQHAKPIDVLTFTDMLITYKRLEEIGGVPYLTELFNTVPTSAHAAYYANIVHKRATRRRIAELGGKITQLALAEEHEEEQLFDTIQKMAESVRPGAKTELLHPSETRQAYYEHLTKPDDLILTGFPQMDEWMGGIGRGDLYILAARPGVGKTAKMLQLIRNIAAQGKGCCLIYSQEMKRLKLYNRMISSMTGIPAKRFRRKNLSPNELDEIMNSYQTLESLPIHIADEKRVTIEEIRSEARMMKRKQGSIAMICVDYLGIMNITQTKVMTRAQAIGEVTKVAKQIAMELDCVFLLLCQMNRESKKACRPSLEHLNESGSIEADADIVEFLWENPEDTHPGQQHLGAKVVQSIIAKGRDIGINEFRYAFKGWVQQFHDLPAFSKGRSS
jgi:replicative DNA helicase